MAIKKLPINNDLGNAAILGAKGVTGGSTTTNNTLPTLKQGSVGGDVVDLQNALIKAGYNVGSTGADGKYGANTAAAVKAYQRDNGLTVDGVAGVQTLGNLYIPGSNALSIGITNAAKIAAGDTNLTHIPKTSKPSTQTATKTGTGGGSDNGGGTEEKKDAVPEAEPVVPSADPVVDPTITTATGFQYDPFTNPALYDEYMSSANNWLSQYENRDPFSYDFNTDALYNQYRDQYVQMGNMAMMDTIGQASAMTGGYGNSYAQMAGQQTYNQYLNQLNEIMPELYDRAYSRYNQEGEDMLNMYALYANRAKSEYDKAWDEYTTDLGIQHGDYGTQLGYDREDKNTAYGKLYTMSGTDYNPSDEELAAAGMTRGEYEALQKAHKEAAATGGGSGDGNTGASGRETTASQEEISAIKNDFARCESEDELLYLVNDLIYRGYGEAWVKILAKQYDKWSNGGNSPSTRVPIYANPTTQNSASRVRSNGGSTSVGSGVGGLGVWQLEVR